MRTGSLIGVEIFFSKQERPFRSVGFESARVRMTEFKVLHNYRQETY